jgi:hypothetical protein
VVEEATIAQTELVEATFVPVPASLFTVPDKVAYIGGVAPIR